MGTERPVHRPTLQRRVADLSPEKREYLERLLRHDEPRPSSPAAIPKRRRSETAPLSYAQQRLWILCQFTPGSPSYNETFSIRIKHPLDVAALERSINEIIRRHEVLRTGFRTEDGAPVQIISETLTLPLPIIDLCSVPLVHRELKAEERMRMEALRPFDLNHDLPFMRTALIRLGEQHHIFLLTMHHIICDGWSMGVFSVELTALYEAFSNGRPSPLPELTIQYADYAVWQRNALAAKSVDSQLDYWLTKLAGLTTLALPITRSRPPIQTYAGARVMVTIAPHVHAALNKLSASEDVTLFVTLLAAFQTLLHRYTGQDDIAVGVPVANRNRAELEGLVGFFVNALVMRTDLSGDLTFRELIARAGRVATGAFANQDVPFEKLVEELQPQRDLSHNPLFQVAFQLFASVGPGNEAPAADSMEFDSVEIGTSKFDLRFDLYETYRGLHGHLEYCTDLFDRGTIERMAGHYQTLLEAAVTNPDQRIADLPLLTAPERDQLLVSWNHTDTAYPEDVCVHDLVAGQARRAPDAVAVASSEGRLTYGELNDRADRLAACLRARGIGPEIPVAVCFKRSLEMVVALLGVLKAGGAYLPMDPAYPRERLAFMLEDARCPLLLTHEPVRGLLPSTSAHQLSIDTEWNEIAGTGVSSLPPVSARTLAYVIYTSGSTGRPRGVEIEHRSLTNLVFWHQRQYRPAPGERATQLAGPAFDASVWELWPYLSAGATICIPDEQTIAMPQTLWRWLASEQITYSFIPTPLAEAMLEEPLPSGLSLRVLLTGGDRLHRAPREPLPFEFVNHYGPTENTVVTTFAPVAAAASPSPSPPPIGRPISNTKVYVLGRNEELLPIGVPGELYIGGDGVARGYRHRPDLTAERFVPDPFGSESSARLYRSGDVVRYRSDGNLEFLGRRDHQVKLRGFRVELGEIESVLNQHPGVLDSVVTLDDDGGPNERLVGYVVLRRARGEGAISGHRLSDEQIGRWRTLYEETYRQPTPVSEPMFNTVGWNDSYTELPLPPEDLSEQVNHTVSRILAFRPARVLEVGCGAGLLLLRIAPHCLQYVGSDFSAAALDYVRAQSSAPRDSCLELVQRDADDFRGFAPGSFDTVILNSTIQYFPSLDYLLTVLERAAGVVAPGGRIFVGDVRNLNLLTAFHTSVELFQAPESLPVHDLRERIRRRIDQEQELVLDPAFFAALPQRVPAITAVEIQLKRGHRRNELTGYRYDVTLRIGEAPAGLEERGGDLDWSVVGSLSSLTTFLRTDLRDTLRLRNVPNQRLSEHLRAQEILERPDPPATCRAIRAQSLSAAAAVDPEAMWELGRQCGFDVRVGYAAEIHAFDVLFRRKLQGNGDEVVNFGAPMPVGEPSESAYATQPLEQERRREVLRELRTFLGQELPDYMIPSVFVVLELLPLTPNGKVDRRALPAPNHSRPALGSAFVSPRTELEQTIAAVWHEILGVEKVGLNDNFFDLGGHSLLIVRLHSRLREQLAVELHLTDLFQRPTVGSLARYLTDGVTETTAIDGVEGRAAKQRAAIVRQRGRVEAPPRE